MNLTINEIILLSSIILFASFTETLSGFGKTIITVTFASNFLQIESILAMILPTNIILSGYVVFKNYKFVNLT